MSDQSRSEHARDKTLQDSFPASDPPANSGVTGDERPGSASHERDTHERPTGTPTSDRHATETAHHWEDEVRSSPEK